MKMKNGNPPTLAAWILWRIIRKEDRLSILSDFSEMFEELAGESGYLMACRWYWAQVARSFPPFLVNQLMWGVIMFKNYVKVAWRNLRKRKMFSFINASGLAIGISCSVLVFLFASDELSYDRFHKNGGSLFRVIRTSYNNADGSVRHKDPDLIVAMASELNSFFPEIQYQSLFASATGVVRYGDKIFRETITLANTPFFQMFSFPLLSGTPASVLSQDDSIVITKRMSEKYFGREDPVGKKVTITFGQRKKDFLVTGVAQDPPRNSSLQFGLVSHISNLPFAYGIPDILNSYDRGYWTIPLFVQLKPESSVKNIEKKFELFTKQFFPAEIERWREGGWTRDGIPFSFNLQPIKDIYLDSSVYRGKGMSAIFILSGIAIMVLITACINFTNLTLGLSSTRSIEIGIRKVFGAAKRQLAGQFWSETILMTAVSCFAGFMLTALVLPRFNSLSGKNLNLNDLLQVRTLIGLAVVSIGAGLLAGLYPSLVMSDFRVVDIMKGKLKIGGRKIITKALIVFQFAMAVGLIIAALVLGRQLHFFIHKDLGYQKEGLVAVLTQEGSPQESGRILGLFQDSLRSHPGVLGISASNAPFGLARYPRSDKAGVSCHFNRVETNFMKTLGLEIVDGRDFNPQDSISADKAIVNESFIQKLGTSFSSGIIIDQTIIEKLGMPEYLLNVRIIGVARDFHFSVLKHEIFPAVYHLKPVVPYSRMLIRISLDQMQGAMDELKKAWKAVQPDKPFAYYFQDEALEALYDAEKKWGAIIQYASILAIVVACLGIFGLTAIMISRRIKEIGIRKVLGAGIGQIMSLMTKDFVVLIVAANVIAWPIVYYLLQRILQNFPYRISLGIPYFILAGLASLCLAVGTILSQIYKAACRNPVDSIRYE